MKKMESYITLITFTFPEDAVIIKTRLEAEGVICFLKDELTLQADNFYPNTLRGVKLLIKKSDYHQVNEIFQKETYLSDEDVIQFSEIADRCIYGIPLLKSVPAKVRLLFVFAGLILAGLALSWMIMFLWP